MPDRERWEQDRRLVASVHRGDPRAAHELVSRLLPRVRNLVRYLVPGDRDVDDLAQSGLLEVLRSVKSFAGRSTVEYWADRIVIRHTRAHLARRSRRERQQREHAPALSVVRPTNENDRFGFRRDVARALDGVPPEQRDAVVLFHVVGMSMRELARETGVSEDTAKSRIRLGMEKLRHVLRDSESER